MDKWINGLDIVSLEIQWTKSKMTPWKTHDTWENQGYWKTHDTWENPGYWKFQWHTPWEIQWG